MLKMSSSNKINIREIQDDINQEISKSTIRRVVTNNNIKYNKMKSIPCLNKIHKSKRINFTKIMLNKGLDFHNKIVF